ncbi:unnamed protein product [Medioppia subpectinata]|uniref:Homeobox domain-containing protein n=1 Tax=Medioppia subpectinata TaxID=1979941 RepID=A0A7R9KDR2_9ACAR|nr:unnamed protein product [Medioppia subpectinata]CAG2100396.1 unnamed protein product [Medioppia subpectinata]
MKSCAETSAPNSLLSRTQWGVIKDRRPDNWRQVQLRSGSSFVVLLSLLSRICKHNSSQLIPTPLNTTPAKRQLVFDMMSYRLSYPLYLDVSEHNKHNAFHSNRIPGYQMESNTNRTAALINLNTFYENMISNGHNRPHVPSLTISSNEYNNVSNNETKKLLPESDSSKSSFSIEAILGINSRPNNNYLSAQDCNQYNFSGIKYRPEYISHQMYVKANNYPKAKSIASVSPDSTAKANNYPKAKSIASVSPDSTAKDDRLIGDDSGSQPKSKRVRTIFTPEQLDKLETQFEKQQYMVGPERLYLASTLNLSEAQVKVWFQNRRIKWRKQHQEKEQALIAKQSNTSDQNTDHQSEHIGSHPDFYHSTNSLDIIH